MKPTQERLHALYVDDKKSIPQIAIELGVGKTTVLKYLTRYDIPRRSISESLSGVPKSREHRHKLSEGKKGNKHPNFGKKCSSSGKRCWYTCPDGRVVSMRSQWEVWYAEYLKQHNIEYAYEPFTFILSDGRAYTPDFHLAKRDEWIEVKGWLTLVHKERLEKFRREFPDKKLIIANREYLERLGIDLRKKWIASKPTFPCEQCGELYHKSYPQQRFCSVRCRNQGKGKIPSEKDNKSKRKYNGIQSGASNNSAKLTVEDIREIRQLHAAGCKLKDIAFKTGASLGNIGNIIAGKSWKEVL